MTELTAAVSVAGFMVVLSLFVGAVICLRDTVQLYRESRTDGMFKLPLTTAIVLILIAALMLTCL